jgi:hypothetical protein
MSDVVEVTSPCIGVCQMNELSGLCAGCYRSIEEIQTWWDMTSDEKQRLKDTLELRMAESASFD